jgi:hypothetical protein
MAYKNFGDMDAKPLTGCIKRGIYALILKEIISFVWREKISSPTSTIMVVNSTCIMSGGKTYTTYMRNNWKHKANKKQANV